MRSVSSGCMRLFVGGQTGLLSNMNGKKATLLEVHARQRGHPFVRFDYRGHGSSDGEFEDTVFGDW